MRKKVGFVILLLVCMYIVINKVEAFTIVLDPGHGGTDSGAIATNGELEKNLNMKVANYLKEYLEPYDVNVYLTHTSVNDTMSILERGRFIRNKKADIGVSLHFNSAPTTSLNGTEVFVTNDTSLPKYNKNCSELGNKIIENITALGIGNRGVKTRLSTGDKTDIYSDGTMSDYYGIIRYSMRGCKINYGKITPQGAIPANVQNGEGVPAIIIEHCFLIGLDYKFVNSDEKLKKFAEADGKALVEYYNIPLKKIREKLKPFEDVYVDDWYAESVSYVYKNHMMYGTNSTHFKPKDNLTRGMLVTVLWRMEGQPKIGNNKFVDVKSDSWYYNAVNWAASKGIIHGYENGNFGPNDNVTREQLAVILNNYAKYKGKNTTKTCSLSNFKDPDKISSYAINAMKWAVASNVMYGNSNKCLNPKGNATRAEVAAMLQRYLIKIR